MVYKLIETFREAMLINRENTHQHVVLFT